MPKTCAPYPPRRAIVKRNFFIFIYFIKSEFSPKKKWKKKWKKCVFFVFFFPKNIKVELKNPFSKNAKNSKFFFSKKILFFRKKNKSTKNFLHRSKTEKKVCHKTSFFALKQRCAQCATQGVNLTKKICTFFNFY